MLIAVRNIFTLFFREKKPKRSLEIFSSGLKEPKDPPCGPSIDVFFKREFVSIQKFVIDIKRKVI